MPHYTKAYRTQKAVLWKASGFDNFGDVTLDAPIEIDVRWQKKWQESLDAEGNTIATEGMVVVDQEVPVGSILWLGSMSSHLDDTTHGDYKQVVSYNETPDLKGRNYRRTVQYVKYSDELPSLT